MADKINLGSFEFDTSKVTKNIEDLRKQLSELKSEEMRLGAETEKNFKIFQEKEKQNNRLLQQQRESIAQGKFSAKEYEKFTTELNKNSKEMKELLEVNSKMITQNQTNRAGIQQLETGLKNLEVVLHKNQEAVRLSENALQQQVKTLNTVKEKTEDTVLTVDQLSSAYNKGQIALKDYQNKLESVNAEMEKLTEEGKSGTAEFRNLKNEYEQTSKAAEQLKFKTEALAGAYKNLNKEKKDTNSGADSSQTDETSKEKTAKVKIEPEVDKNNIKNIKFSDLVSIDETDIDFLESYRESLKDIEDQVNKDTEALKEKKKHLEELKEKLQDLTSQGKEWSGEYKKTIEDIKEEGAGIKEINASLTANNAIREKLSSVVENLTNWQKVNNSTSKEAIDLEKQYADSILGTVLNSSKREKLLEQAKSTIELTKQLKEEEQERLGLLQVRLEIEKKVNGETSEGAKLLISQIEQAEGKISGYNNTISLLNSEVVKMEQSFGARLKNSVSETFDQAKEKVKSFGEALGSVAESGLNKLGQGFEFVGKSVNQAIDGLPQFKAGLDEIGGGFSKIKTGDFVGGISQMKTGIVDFGQTLLTGFSNPVSAAATVIQGLVTGFQAWYNYNEKIAEQTDYLSKNIGTEGESLKALRAELEATSTTMGVDFKEAAEAVNTAIDFSMAKDEFAALEEIQIGLLQTSDKNQFLQDLENNAAAAEKLGMNLGEVRGTLLAVEGTGNSASSVFKAMETGSDNLKNKTNELGGVLQKNLGKEFSDKILKDIQTGQISVTEGMQQIAVKSKEAGLTQQQQAEISKAMFGKSAEAAGGYNKMLDTIVASHEKENAELTENQKKQKELANVTGEVERAFAGLFDQSGGGFEAMKLDFQIMVGKYITKFLDAIYDVVNGFIDIYNESAIVKTGIQILGSGFKIIFKAIGTNIENVWGFMKAFGASAKDVISGVLKAIENLSSGNFEAAFNNIKNIATNVGNHFAEETKKAQQRTKELGDAVITEGKKIADAKNNPNIEHKGKPEKEAGVNTKKGDGKTDEPVEKGSSTGGSGGKKGGGSSGGGGKPSASAEPKEDLNKKAEEEIKKMMEADAARKKQVAEQSINNLNKELEVCLAVNKSKLEDGKKVTKEMIDEERKRLETIFAKKEAILAKEKELDYEALEEKIKNDKAEMESKKKAIEDEYAGRADLKEKLLQLLQDGYAQENILNAKRNEELDLQYQTEEQKLKDEKEEENKKVDEADRNRKLEKFQEHLKDLEQQGVDEFTIRQQQLDFQYENDEERKAEKKAIEDELKTIEAEEERLRLEDKDRKLGDDTLKRKAALFNALGIMEAQRAADEKKITDEKEQAKYQAYAAVAGGIAKIAGENTVLGKAAAVTEATINTYLAATTALNNPFPLNIVATATTIASGLMSVAKIVGIDTGKATEKISAISQTVGSVVKAGNLSKSQPITPPPLGYSTGGYTGAGAVEEVAGLVHKGEVVFSQQDISMMGGAGVVEAMRPTSSNYTGVNPVNTATVQQSVVQGINMELLASSVKQGVYEGALVGTQVGSQQGIADLSTNTQIARGADF